MRDSYDVCGCFPTGRHYAGIAAELSEAAVQTKGLSSELGASDDWREAKLAAIDLETTGLTAESDRIIEVGIARFEKGRLVDRKNWLVNPGIPVPEAARAVHQISDEELAQAPRFAEVFPQFCQALKGHLPIAYNADFDRGFINAEIARLGPSSPPLSTLPAALQPHVTWIDPLIWARELQRYEKGKKLTEVCARLGIELTEAHRAAGDAEAAGKVLFALAQGMPATYGELIRLQKQYAARQELDLAAWRKRRA